MIERQRAAGIAVWLMSYAPDAQSHLEASTPRLRRDVNAELQLYEPTPSSAEKAAEHCAALRRVAEQRGNVAEPYWRAALGVVKFSMEGPDLAHKWSDGHPRYDYDETQTKFDRYAGTGPTRCQTFEGFMPSACAGCEHRGRITTPLQLGRLASFTDAEPASPEPVPLEAAEANDVVEAAHATDLDLSRVFVNLFGDRFRFDHALRCWRQYVEGCWRPCRKAEEQEAFKIVSARLLEAAGKAQGAGNSDKAKRAIQAALRAQSANGIAAALKLASSDAHVATSTDEFDRDPDLLNVANGVVHLPTAELRPHAPELMLSRLCPVNFAADAHAPTWLRFVGDVTQNDQDLIDYLQRVCGYALGGHVVAERIFFMLGVGANGKSVFANVMRHILGSYVVVVPSAFLMQSRRDGGSATPDLAMLAGARLALANEVEAGAVLSAQTVKVAASTEHITARALYGQLFTFAPTHKLWVRGNHRPIVRDNDEGIWRRIDLIPFERSFAPEERDEGLEAKLLAEAPGILAWMVEGFRRWRADGRLRTARRVEAASRAYRAESDLLQQWITDRCAASSAATVPQVEAYRNYQRWCDEQGMRWISKRSFTSGLIERGYSERREGNGQRRMLYAGLSLSR